MAKDGERTLTGLARRVEVFLDLVIFNELRKIALAEDTTVSKILTQIVIEHFRERGVPRRGLESQRHGSRPPGQGGPPRETPQPNPAAGSGPQAGLTGEQPGARRRRRRRRGGRGPKSDGGSGEASGESGG